MRLEVRTRSLAALLLVATCLVAVQQHALAAPSATVQTITGPAKIGYDAATAAPAMRLWSDCVTAANTARRVVGAAPLQLNIRIAMAAAGHSAYQAQTQTMSHTGYAGSNTGDRLTAAGYTWSTWGENVAAGQANCDTVISAWLASAPHRANILNPAFRHIGIGMVLSSTGVPYWTMDLAAGG